MCLHREATEAISGGRGIAETNSKVGMKVEVTHFVLYYALFHI